MVWDTWGLWTRSLGTRGLAYQGLGDLGSRYQGPGRPGAFGPGVWETWVLETRGWSLGDLGSGDQGSGGPGGGRPWVWGLEFWGPGVWETWGLETSALWSMSSGVLEFRLSCCSPSWPSPGPWEGGQVWALLPTHPGLTGLRKLQEGTSGSSSLAPLMTRGDGSQA